MKFVVGILTSSNEKLLKVSYNSVVNQVNHNIDYKIMIVVNSLNKTYYNDVCKEFEDYDVNIIETESNGKPGKGHNSVIHLFKKQILYDYLILLDGDDFLYPSAFEQLDKCFKKQEKIDMLVLKSTNKLKYFDSNEADLFDIHLNNNFYVNCKPTVEYKIYPWSEEHMQLSNFTRDSLCTPFRLFLIHRNVFNYFCEDLYHEECKLYDDYLMFLYFIELSNHKNLNCFIIPATYIYLYNGLNINSTTFNTKEENDILYYKKLTDRFNNSIKFLGNSWDLTKLRTLYISDKYEENLKYDIDLEKKNIKMNYNYNKFITSKNTIFIKNNTLYILQQLIDSYHNMAQICYENKLYIDSLKYSLFFNTHHINNTFISFIIIYSIHKLYQTNISNYHVELFKKHVTNAKVFIQYHNIEYLNNYCKAIQQLE